MVQAPDRRWHNQPLVRERDERRVRGLWLTLLGIVLAIAPIGVHLLQRNECLKLSYAASELRSQQEQLVDLEQRLRFERAALESLSDLEDWAVAEHGLHRPGPEQVVVLGEPARPRDHLVARWKTANPPSN